MTKVIHVNSSAAWGGLEQYTLYLIGLQKKHGLNAKLICRPSTPIDKHRDGGIIASHFKSASRVNYELFHTLTSESSENTVYHVHRSRDLLSVVLASLVTKCPVILHSHFVPTPKSHFIHKMLYKRLSALVTPSRIHALSMQGLIPIETRRIHVIRHARNCPQNVMDRQEARSELGLQSDAFIVGYFGRIDPQKGIAELLGCLNHLPETLQSKVQILIVGDPTYIEVGGVRQVEPPSEELYRLTLKTAAADQRVVYMKSTANLDVHLAAVDATVLPSYKEMFSLSVLESMLANRAVIGTNTGGTIEQLQGGRGLTITPRSALEIARAITAYSNDSGLMMAHQNAAKLWAVRECDPESVVGAYSRLYNNLIKEDL